MAYRVSEDIKAYKINTTKISDLKELDIATLRDILKEWSRIGNMRATRVSKIDPYYSRLHEYNKGGKFGEHEKYRDKDTILDELRRIRFTATDLNVTKAKEESAELSRIVKILKDETKDLVFDETIDEEKLRQGFAMYRQYYTSINNEVYDKVKEIVRNISDHNLYDVYYLIVRLVDEYSDKVPEERQKTMEPPKTFSRTNEIDDLPKI